jgi:hypothetical protein
MHNLFAKVRINRNREFFSAPLKLIIEVGNIVHEMMSDDAKTD